MKKLVCIFMVMIAAFVFAGMAYGEDATPSESEVYGWLTEWVNNFGYNEYYDHELNEEGVMCTKGVISKAEFRELTEMEWSLENLKKTYYDCEKYGYDWDVKDVEIRIRGHYGDYEIYELKIRTEKVPLGDYMGIDFYEVDILFMVCE